MKNKLKNINKYSFIWAGFCLAYIIFIGALTWLFPYGADEMFYSDFSKFIDSIIHPCQAVRIGIILNGFFLQIDKIIFVILNSFIQLFTIFSAFYFIYMRFPCFDTLKDFGPFLLLLVFGTFFIVQPSDTILWIGGSLNYLWCFLPFIWFLIYLRKLDEGEKFKNKYFLIICILGGLFLGFMNENNSPMILCLMILFIIYAHYKKIILHKDFWLLFLAVTVSVFLFFKVSRNDLRLQVNTFGFPMSHTLSEKLFMHLSHMHRLANANLWLIYLMPLFLLLLFLDKGKELLKDKFFYLSSSSWIVAFGLSIVLCEAPLVSNRAFFSASWFCIFSLFFMLLEIEKLYKVRLIKYLTFVFVLAFLYIAPLFTMEVISLKQSVDYRQIIIDNAKENKRKEIYLDFVSQVVLLPDNLSMNYYDCLRAPKDMSEMEGITIKKITADNVRSI